MTFQVEIRSAEGLRKISVTRELQSSLGLRLSEAKAITDRVLNGESVAIDRPSLEVAEQLAARLTALGAVTAVRQLTD